MERTESFHSIIATFARSTAHSEAVLASRKLQHGLKNAEKANLSISMQNLHCFHSRAQEIVRKVTS